MNTALSVLSILVLTALCHWQASQIDDIKRRISALESKEPKT